MLQRQQRRGPSWRRLLSTIATTPTQPLTPPSSLLHEAAQHWQSHVTSTLHERLLRDGFAVIHHAFPRALTRHLRDEMRYLHATDQLYANATHILLPGEPRATLLHKHHILETELVLPDVRRQVPTLQWLFDSQLVYRSVAATMPSWLGLGDHMIKLQYNQGHGGCFPFHFDSYGDDGKCITAVLYLNDGWQEGDGGEMVLYPFPRQQPARVVVRPQDGDMVLFSSQHMLHRVLPSSKPRYCLTTWMYYDQKSIGSSQHTDTTAGRAQYYRPSVHPPETYALEVLERVMRSTFRRHLAKLYHHAEWRQSLVESHDQTEAFAAYMATQEKEIAVIENAATQMLAKFRAKDKMQPSRVPQTADELLLLLRSDEGYMKAVQDMQVSWF